MASINIEKTVYWHKALGRRRFAMQVIPREIFMDGTALLRNGDIVGFVTQRPNLDYFHIGFVAFGDDGRFLLRHASRKAGIACSTSAWTASSRRTACTM